MKYFVAIFLLLSVVASASAAITGPYPVGPGANPLPSAVAVITRYDVCLDSDSTRCIVVVLQYVSAAALIAKVPAGTVNFEMTVAEFKEYVTDPISSGVIKNYESGIENWLMTTKLPGWTRVTE